MHRQITLIESGRVIRIGDDDLLSSVSAEWHGFPVEIHDARPHEGEVRQRHNPHALLVMSLNGRSTSHIRSGVRHYRMDMAPGLVGLFAQGFELDSATWQGEATRGLSMELRAHELRRWCDEDKTFDLVSDFSIDDETLRRLLTAVRDEIQGGCFSGRLYAEGLSMSLAAYIYARYGARSASNRPSGRLSAADLNKLQDCVWSRISENLSIADLAATLNMSERHFARRFKATTGMPPYQYVQEIRVQRALRLLNGKMPIAQIAQVLGFSTQAHFTQVFRERTGVTPARARADF